MGKYYDMLCQDVRFEEGLKACINCGVCTGVCPAAEFYDYDPRQIISAVQRRDDGVIEELMKSESIWYCGECMSCRPRCPRTNTPAYVIQALRTLSQRLGLFVHSEKGRQQYAIKKAIGENILEIGYCIHPTRIAPEDHLEQGPVWEWIHENNKDLYSRFSENYDEIGPGAMRKLDGSSLDELHKIFDVTGGTQMFDTIEKFSREKAAEMGLDIDSGEYAAHVYKQNTPAG